MSDEIENVELSEEEQMAQYELESLRSQAEMLGVKYSANIGIETLRKRVQLAREENEIAAEAKVEKAAASNSFEAKKKAASKLVRVRITCMNPNKKAWPGEIFSVGSAKLGTFKKFVPFNADDGWHVPQIMLDMIRSRKFSTFYDEVGPKGQKVRKSRLIPEYSVEVLPDLTENELKELARKQALANGSD